MHDILIYMHDLSTLVEKGKAISSNFCTKPMYGEVCMPELSTLVDYNGLAQDLTNTKIMNLIESTCCRVD